jgi:hypothetical protein
MNDWLTIITTIIALGGVKSILIITFLFWAIGLRGIVGSVLALVLGAAFVLSAHNVKDGQTEQQLMTSRITVEMQNYFQGSLPELEQKFGKPNAEMILAVASDLTSGLKAVVVLIPFLLIDLVALFLFRLLDLGSYKVEYITLPLKVLLFLSVDGVGVVTKLMALS